MMSDWRPLARDRYDPLKAGSIDGTDTEPHDRAVWRAMKAHYIPPDVDTKPSHTLFVGRLPHDADEEQLHHKFSAFGVVEKIHLIRDIVTGYSKGYCFVEYRKERDAEYAMRESTDLLINGCPVLVDWEAGHRVKGWVPRRLGGGWGGRKEAGQLRFGCRDRPWKKPIVIHPPRPPVKHHGKEEDRTRSQDRYRSSEDRYNKNEDRYDRNEDRHNRKEDRYDKKEDRFDRKEDRFDRKEDRYDRKEDRYDRKDWHNRKEDRDNRIEDRHSRKEDRYNRNEDRHNRKDRDNRIEDRHSRKDDWDNRKEDWDRNEDQPNRKEDRCNKRENRDDRSEGRQERKDSRKKGKKSRREDRRDRHTDSSTSHKRKHTSVSN